MAHISLDIHEYEQSELMLSSSIAAAKGNSMPVSSVSFVTDQSASNYSSYSTNFNLSSLQNSYTDKSEDWLAIPWTLYSTSATGFAGTETPSWKSTPLAMFQNISEVSVGSAQCTLFQENNTYAFREIELAGQVTVSAGGSTLEEIGMNLDDAVYPGTTGAYTLNGNSALVDRQQFFLSNATYSTGSPATIGFPVGATGYWSGVANIRCKFLSDYRMRAGIRKYGFQFFLTFVNPATSFPFYIPSAQIPSGAVPTFKVGNPTTAAINYYYRRLQFSDAQEKAMLADISKPLMYSTYSLAGGTFLNNAIQTNQQQEINISQGTVMPTHVVFYGNPTGSYLNPSFVSPFITTTRFSSFQLQVDQTYSQPNPWNTPFLQYTSFQECGSHYGNQQQGPYHDFQIWINNCIYKVLCTRQALNQGDNPLASRQLTLTLNRSDSATGADVYCAIYWSQAVQFVKEPSGDYSVVQNIKVLDKK